MTKNIYSQKVMMLLRCTKKLVILMVLAAFVAFSGGFVAVAAELLPPELESRREELREAVVEADLIQCPVVLEELYEIETREFLQFLDNNFKNKSSTTSLSNIAIARYRLYKETLQGYYGQLTPDASTFGDIQEYEVALESYGTCGALTDSYIRLAKAQMIRHIKNNSVQKKTSILLEKFQAINEKLRDLNSAVAELYSFFAAFKNKLPGFLRNCL